MLDWRKSLFSIWITILHIHFPHLNICKASGSHFFIVIKQIVYVLFLLFLFVKLEGGHSFDILVILYQSHLVLWCWRFKQLFWIYRLNLFGTKLTILENGKSWHKVDHHLVMGWVDLCKRVHNCNSCKDN